MSESVFPTKKTITENCGQVGNVVTEYVNDGLTKRELFAAMAMQGLATQVECGYQDQVAGKALYLADALIKALGEKEQGE